MRAPFTVLFLAALSAHAAALPGFRVQLLGATSGFASSIAIDSHNTIYYTTTAGGVFRFSDGKSEIVTHVNTTANGDSGLLGMALRGDNTAIVHYTTPALTADVVSSIDLTTGAETILHSFVCDKDVPQRASPSEHHGGNPTVAADGSIFVGIGDYGGWTVALLPHLHGGKNCFATLHGGVVRVAVGFLKAFGKCRGARNPRVIASRASGQA